MQVTRNESESTVIGDDSGALTDRSFGNEGARDAHEGAPLLHRGLAIWNCVATWRFAAVGGIMKSHHRDVENMQGYSPSTGPSLYSKARDEPR